MDPRDERNKALCGRFPLEPWTIPKIMPYDIKDKKYLVLIDTLAAIYAGVTWSQTESFAVLGELDVPHCCILGIVDISTGAYVFEGCTLKTGSGHV
jgi:hypothetical protein